MRGASKSAPRRAARQHALAEHHLHIKIVEIVDNGKIGQIARRDGAAVVQGEVAGGVVAGRLHGDDGIDAVVDGLADEIVDVALFQQVARVLVVRAEHAAVVIRLYEQIDEILEVVGGCAVADHDELAVAQLRHGIVHIGALVVGIDARRDIGSQILAGQAGRMTVAVLPHGTTTVITDPHEITNVMGTDGIDYMLQAILISAGVEFDQLVKKVPSGLFRQAAFRIATCAEECLLRQCVFQ